MSASGDELGTTGVGGAEEVGRPIESVDVGGACVYVPQLERMVAAVRPNAEARIVLEAYNTPGARPGVSRQACELRC
jgi:hypothetical protein